MSQCSKIKQMNSSSSQKECYSKMCNCTPCDQIFFLRPSCWTSIYLFCLTLRPSRGICTERAHRERLRTRGTYSPQTEAKETSAGDWVHPSPGSCRECQHVQQVRSSQKSKNHVDQRRICLHSVRDFFKAELSHPVQWEYGWIKMSCYCL